MGTANQDAAARIWQGTLTGSDRDSVELETPDLCSRLLQLVWEQHTRPDLTLAVLSAQLCRSERQVRRLFQDATGQSFCQYLRTVRIQQATELLSGSRHDIKNVSLLVGYRYVSHFSEDFRRVMRCTPSEFRANSVPNGTRISAPI